MEQIHMEPQKIGALINKLRTQKNMTQKDLAEKLNVTDKAVSKWERGECCPDISLIAMMRDMFNIDIENFMNGEIPPEVQKDLTGKVIKLYDFNHPDILSKEQMRTIWNVFQLLCKDFGKIVSNIYPAACSFNIASVDELTNEEFIRTIPNPSFLYDYSYNDNGFVIQFSDALGKELLKQNKERFPNLTAFDFEALLQFFVNKMADSVQTAFYNHTNKAITKEQFMHPFKAYGDNLLFLEQTGNQMCCLVTVLCKIGDWAEPVNFQFPADYFSKFLKKLDFYGNPTHIKNLSNIKRVSNYNTFVEFGRFTADEISFNPDDIVMLDRQQDYGLMLIHNNKLIGTGEPVVLYDRALDTNNWGIRLFDFPDKEVIFDEKDYISVRLASRFCSEEEIANLQEGTVLEMSESVQGSAVSIIKNGRKIAQGEIIVVDKKYAVKIVE